VEGGGLVGKLRLENEVLGKGLQNSLSGSFRNGTSSGYGGALVLLDDGGVR